MAFTKGLGYKLGMRATLVRLSCALFLIGCSQPAVVVDDGTAEARDGGGVVDGVLADAAPDLRAMCADTLAANRDCLLRTYFDYLKSQVTRPQTNGLSGSNVASVCEVWSKLDPSSRAVFLLVTARLQGSVLGIDDRSMLSHVTRVYRIAGGQGATATEPGSCGGETNRMFMSMDATLHSAQLAASQHRGARQPNNKYDISDVISSSYWRDSHDLGGAHAPFDASNETQQGAPRGQTQYFRDPTSKLASSPLGRVDVMTLVDPYALEMDHDFDCVHNSNPLCKYVTYGPLCTPKALAVGTEIYTQTYGSFEPDWKPTGCP